ncbi:MAG: dihydrofolate reductase [Gammaproteobacteria bacterium]|nr:dihydrofolate reductase [Gammaproteobacteria bacterium]
MARGEPAVPRITLVAAVADNGVIGARGALPWHLPDDLRHFKALTFGHPVLMGRRTFAAIGRPLPGRRNLVLTRGAGALPAGVEAVGSLAAALARCAGEREVFVIGGGEVYRQALPLAARLELTRVHACPEGDAWFVLPDAAAWREVRRCEHCADDRHAHAMTFQTLDRVAAPRAPA